MFPKVRKLLSKAELEDLVAQMEELKTQLFVASMAGDRIDREGRRGSGRRDESDIHSRDPAAGVLGSPDRVVNRWPRDGLRARA